MARLQARPGRPLQSGRLQRRGQEQDQRVARRCLPCCKPALSVCMLALTAQPICCLQTRSKGGNGSKEGSAEATAQKGQRRAASSRQDSGQKKVTVCACAVPACCACSLHTHTPPRICMLSLAACAWRPWKLPKRMQASSGAHSARESRPNQTGAPKTPDDEEQHSKVTTRAEWERIVQQAPPYDDVLDHAPIDWSLPDDEIPAGEASISDGLCSVTRHVTGLGREAECDKRVLLSAVRRRGCP